MLCGLLTGTLEDAVFGLPARSSSVATATGLLQPPRPPSTRHITTAEASIKVSANG